MEAELRYHLVTFGCQMNVHDSEIIAGILEANGYTPTDDIEDADLIIFNTCCVRENPERKVYGRVGQLRQLKERKPDLIIGICGCMVQQEGEPERIGQRLPHVDLVFGTYNIHRLPELLRWVRESGGKAFEVWSEARAVEEQTPTAQAPTAQAPGAKEPEEAPDNRKPRTLEMVEGLPIKRADGLHAWVTIMYGCDNFCSYCIVPYVRGRERSRPFDEIVREVEELGEKGFREVTLLGQNVNAYGKGLPDGVDFADLLRRLDEVPGIERIRYTTSHPRDFTDKMIDVIAGSKKVCEHFHLPLQAGSNRILQQMNRGYTREYYLGLVERIRERIPEASFTTDLMVGFPGETEEDFQDTLDMVRRVEFDSAFTFIYSRRRGTRAAAMPDQVDESVKHERIERLIALQNSISLKRNQTLVGKTVEILVEGESETDPNVLQGRTRTNKVVLFKGDPAEYYGKLINARVTAAQTWTLSGELTGLAESNA